MSKRFTDTDKWKKGFIKSLDPSYKLLWLYILDECDHAGIWHVEIEVAEMRLGIGVDIDEVMEVFQDKIIPIDNNEKWFISDFISFQYGTLNPENRAHNSVIERLNKAGIDHKTLNENKPLISPLQGGKDKDMDKDMDKEQEGECEGEIKPTPGISPFDDPELEKQYQKYKSYMKKDKSRIIGIDQEVMQRDFLRNKADPIEIIKHTMRNGWMKLVEPEKNNHGNKESRADTFVRRSKALIESLPE